MVTLSPRRIVFDSTLIPRQNAAFCNPEGLNAIAAPVHNHEGEVVAAVSVSGPAYRVSPQ
ncbi:MAG TPA: hypothetical protein EYP04_00450 [Anaerolineae bacterium]|nr:hypothetical protein [Anaerolineae bacterium]HIQ04230.1 hypothetical protein [Anaerolineae bacterium]